MTEVKIIQNDKLYDLNFTLEDAAGVAIDITNTTIKFKTQQVGTAALKVNGSMAIVDATAGKCKYVVQATDFDNPGKYYGEIEVTFSGGQITTFADIVINVLAELPKT